MQGLMSQKMNCIAPVCFCLVAMCTCLHSLTKFHSWKPYQVQRSPFIEIYSIWFYQKQCIFMAKVSATSEVHSCAFKNCLKNLTFRSFFMVLHRSCSDFDSVVFPSQTSQWRQKRMEKTQPHKIHASRNTKTLAVWFAGVPCKSIRIPAWSPGITKLLKVLTICFDISNISRSMVLNSKSDVSVITSRTKTP